MAFIVKNNQKLNKIHVGIIHRAFISKFITTRNHLASTKTRGEVSGSGKKPWNQKGTGNARAGSKRSPIWRGGGVTFGPKPHNVIKKINKKEYSLAINLVLQNKYLKNEIFFINDLNKKNFEKTKELLSFLKPYNILPENNILILQKNINRVFKTLTKIKLKSINSISLKDLLNTKYIFIDSNTDFLLSENN